MRFAQVHAEKAQFTVQALCDALDVSTSGYYAWAKRRPSRTNRRANRTRQVDAVRQAFHRSRGRYGSRRVHAELRARGHRISRRSVEELMRDQGLVARPRRRFKATTDSTHADPIAPNLLKRDFTASRPDQVWVGDVTAIATLEGWLFLAVLIDLHSRRVVGWSTSVANDRHLASMRSPKPARTAVLGRESSCTATAAARTPATTTARPWPRWAPDRA